MGELQLRWRSDDVRRSIMDIPKDQRPKLAVILGTGLGWVKDEVEGPKVQSLDQIIDVHVGQLNGHDREVILGKIKGLPVLVFAGRLHLYEGHSPQDIVQSVLLAHALGCTHIVISNAAGGLGLGLTPGKAMVIIDHMGLFMPSPLAGPNNTELGPRFPGMSAVYDKWMRVRFMEAAVLVGNQARFDHGVYAAVPGPQYETPAEVRLLKGLGVQAVGMSTIPEALVANWLGMKVFGLSVITNAAAGETTEEPEHGLVTQVGQSAEVWLKPVMLQFFDLLRLRFDEEDNK